MFQIWEHIQRRLQFRDYRKCRRHHCRTLYILWQIIELFACAKTMSVTISTQTVTSMYINSLCVRSYTHAFKYVSVFGGDGNGNVQFWVCMLYVFWDKLHSSEKKKNYRSHDVSAISCYRQDFIFFWFFFFLCAERCLPILCLEFCI